MITFVIVISGDALFYVKYLSRFFTSKTSLKSEYKENTNCKSSRSKCVTKLKST